MEENKELEVTTINGYLVSAGISFTVFWMLVILKESYEAVNNLLAFYKPIGPLIGLFSVSLFVFVLVSALFQIVKIKDQAFAFWFLSVTSILFALMVFPPIFEPIVHALGGE